MLGLHDLRAELPGSVALELAADERDERLGVLEHERRAVEHDEPLASGDEVEQGFLLFGRDLRVVRVEHQRVVVRERLGHERLGGRVDVRDLDALAGQRRRDHPVQRVRVVVPLVLAEQQDLERPERRPPPASRRAARRAAIARASKTARAPITAAASPGNASRTHDCCLESIWSLSVPFARPAAV